MVLAVLTGDLVRSTDLGPDRLELAMSRLAERAVAAAAWHGASLRFSRSRGDGWQVCLRQPRFALRTALFLRAGLCAGGRDLITRIAIATGNGDPGPGDLNQASGPVFVESGRSLDALRAPAMMAFAGGGAMGAAVRLADHISLGWTAAQARAITPALAPDPPVHRAIADELGITRQAVDQALEAAGHPALRAALQMIEEAG